MNKASTDSYTASELAAQNKQLQEEVAALKAHITDLESTQQQQQQLTTSRETQLSFITTLTASTLQESSIIRTLERFISQCAEFLHVPLCCYLQPTTAKTSSPADEASEPTFQAACIAGHNEAAQTQFLSAPLEQQLHLSNLMTALAEIHFESQMMPKGSFIGDTATISTDSEFIFVLPVRHNRERIGICIFFYERDSDIDINALQTMESARTLINIAIQQKVAAQSLTRRYRELEQTYKKLENTQEQLVQTEKMASIGQLAAGIAHEINNPVGFVLSNFDMLKDYLDDIRQLISSLEDWAVIAENRDAQETWSQLKQQADIEYVLEDLEQLVGSSIGGLDRVKKIVSGLNTFSHTDNTMVQLDINDILRRGLSLTDYPHSAPYDVHFNLLAQAHIKGNTEQIEQVIISLLVNAIQAMPDGGKLQIASYIDEGRIAVSIKDGGCGIPEENLSKIFTPFFTTKPVGVGTGLGLAIVYAILEGHNATIEVTSELAVGTEFILRFPCWA